MLLSNAMEYETMMSESPVISKEYLSRVLHLNPTQSVQEILVDKVEESNTALTIRFCAQIAEHSRDDAKQRFFAKTVKSSGGKQNTYHDISTREAEFYQLASNYTKELLPIVRCYDAYLSEGRQSFFILLEDVSDTYIEAGALNLSDRDTWLSAAECLARFHAAFWNLNGIELPSAVTGNPEEAIKGTYSSYDKFKACIDNRFDRATMAMFEKAVDINVAVIKENHFRKLGRKNVTLVHDDSHIHNFLFPRQAEGKPLLVDFQFWGIGNGAGDLAHLSRSFPDPSFMPLHRPLLERYHQTLVELGVQNYSFENCWIDYRKQIATMLLIPVWQYAYFGLPYEDWISDIPILKMNYEALDCGSIDVFYLST